MKDKKRLKIYITILLIGLLIVGISSFFIVNKLKDKDETPNVTENQNKEETPSDNKENDENKNENQEPSEEPIEDPEPNDDEDEDDDEEFFNNSAREKFSKADISLKTENDIEIFIENYNSTFQTSDFLIGAFFNDQNTDYLKIAYTIDSVIHKSEIEYGFEIDLNTTDLEKLVGQVFSDPKINYNSIKKDYFTHGSVFARTTFKKDTVNISAMIGGGTGPYEGYLTKIVDRKTNGTNKEYYVKVVFAEIEWDKDEETVKNYLLKNKNTDSKVIGQVSFDSLYLVEYDELVKNIDENDLYTYKFTFSEDNKFISCEKE